MRRLIPLCFFLFGLLLISTRSLAGEQYTSRLYIDIEQDATENVALSVSELEKQIETLQDDFARASAEKFLAQHYAASKDYPKAIAHLEDALKRPGMTDSSRRDMLADLARLYVLQKDYNNAASAIKRYLDSNPPENPEMYLLLAQIHYKNKKYVDSAAALDKVLFNKNAPLQKNPPPELLQSALSIYYSIGNYQRSIEVIKLLIEQDINSSNEKQATLWQQWISLELKTGQKADALTVMSLAWEKGIPFREQDVLLLCDLYAINKVPGRGARVLEEAMQSGRIPANSKINDRLFRLWLQAGERDKAQKALEKAAQLGDDKDLQLHLAQLYMEKEQWQPMQDMVLKACSTALPDALVARANLYLGISQFKLGDVERARRSFINATQIGGENEKAGQWLSYIKAAPATEREKIGVAGPCYSNSTKSIWTSALPDKNETDEIENIAAAESNNTSNKNITVGTSANYADLLTQLKGNPKAVVNSKVTESKMIYVAEATLSAEEFADRILSTAIRLGVTISKNGGSINGPMHFIYPQPPGADGKIKVRFGFPVRGNPKNSSGFKLLKDPGMKCVWRNYKGSAEDVTVAIAQLYLDAQLQGYQFTGESRQIASNDNSAASKIIELELQLGVK